MLSKIDTVLYNALLEKNLITKELLDSIVENAISTNQQFKFLLIEEGQLSEETILELLSEKLSIPFINLKQTQIDRALIEKIPIKFASYYKFVPVKIENGVLNIAVSYPLNITTQDEIRTHLGYPIKEILAKEKDIIEILKSLYGLGADTIQEILVSKKELPELETVEKVEEIEKLAEGASVIRLVNQIIIDAYNQRATDIHIEPYREEVRLRYRIDGVLQDAKTPPQLKNFLKAITSRLKIMSNLNIVEHRLPQDGRAIVKIHDKTMNLRISCLPTPFGESIVIRILPMQLLFNLENLGFTQRDLEVLEDLIKRPHGIIFVTGPTGSGKTTTLYAFLNKINTGKKKIITIEDPIEYEMKNITQVQVLPQIGLDFARGLRSMLRHDPDVMMVGEVRDFETAEIAIRIALTGHLIFSTLHTNDAASGVTRLIDMGIEPYLITSSVLALIAQRLVKVICPKCKKENKDISSEIKSLIAKELKISELEIKIYFGKGCEKCNFTGYYERTAIYEILLLNEKINELILKRAPSSEIKKLAIENGMVTLRQNGWQKVIKGITTPDEVINVTGGEIL